jgi:hypothetical protein
MIQKVGFAVVHTSKRVCPHDRPMYVVNDAIKKGVCLSIRKVLEKA